VMNTMCEREDTWVCGIGIGLGVGTGFFIVDLDEVMVSFSAAGSRTDLVQVGTV